MTPPTKFRCIVADPPWDDVKRRIGKGGRRKNATTLSYRTMSDWAIRALPVHSVSDIDCVLFLWSTRRKYREGIAALVARSWGFTPVGEMIWGLRNPGTGSRTFANDFEPVLVAVAGNPRLEHTEPLGVFFWRQVYEYGPAGVPQKVHSAKPPGCHETVEQMTDGPRLELFAREQRLGWESWGHEAFNHVELTA